jgi:hypothetical protein
MPNLFNTKPNDQYGGAAGIQDVKNLAPVLTTNAYGGDINVIKRFPWSLLPSTSKALDEVPYIRLKEYYLLDSAFNQMFKVYGGTISGNGASAVAAGLTSSIVGTIQSASSANDRLYEGMYDHNSYTGFTYTLPYFSTEAFKNINNWKSKPMFKEFLGLQSKTASTAASVAVGAASIGADLWKNRSEIAAAGVAGEAIGASIGAFFFGAGAVPGAAIGLGVGTVAGTIYEIVKATQAAKARATLASGAVSKGIQLDYLYKRLQLATETGLGIGEDPAIDKPQIWTNTTPRSFSISFPLFNTLDTSLPLTQITSNWELCFMLAYQNLYNKRNIFTGIPPVFYELEVPGVHYTKAAYVSNLKISNVGNTRRLYLPASLDGSHQYVNIPDAYMIDMTLTDFFMPSKNFLDNFSDPGNNQSVNFMQGTGSVLNFFNNLSNVTGGPVNIMSTTSQEPASITVTKTPSP